MQLFNSSSEKLYSTSNVWLGEIKESYVTIFETVLEIMTIYEIQK